MSVEAMRDVVTRLMTERDFRHYEQIHPVAALEPYDLTEEERAAIGRRDLFKLEELGLEPWTARWITALR